MPEYRREIEEETTERLVLLGRFDRPLWQIILFLIILLPILVLLLDLWVPALVGLVTGVYRSVESILFASLLFMVAFHLFMGTFHLVCRVLLRKRRSTFDKRRGTLEVKMHVLTPLKVIPVSWSELVGVGYVRIVIGEKQPDLELSYHSRSLRSN